MTINQLQLPLNLSPENVYPFLGIDKEQVSPKIRKLVTRYLHTVCQQAQPRAIWKTFDISNITPQQITLEDSRLVLEGSGTVNHFITCNKISLFAVTIGSRIDALLEEIGRDNAAHALIIDGAASTAVEYLADQIDSLLSRDIRRQGFYPTARFSPGYGNWPLSWQKFFLESLESEKIDLKCTSYFLLQPVKSITAAIGWSREPVERSYQPLQRKKACQSTISCQACPLSPYCKEISTSNH